MEAVRRRKVTQWLLTIQIQIQDGSPTAKKASWEQNVQGNNLRSWKYVSTVGSPLRRLPS
ncbi:hypothetical protein HYC85_030675 [Camellia sinensis]|uniref:Uncharacterized protein n=1 Tax=Camellia sinensis TaxID=4442 RepID=A0A7J7G591_CAMSI|nr:hypothetical protein HYC85_030675 [Camellia sinensis]